MTKFKPLLMTMIMLTAGATPALSATLSEDTIDNTFGVDTGIGDAHFTVFNTGLGTLTGISVHFSGKMTETGSVTSKTSMSAPTSGTFGGHFDAHFLGSPVQTTFTDTTFSTTTHTLVPNSPTVSSFNVPYFFNETFGLSAPDSNTANAISPIELSYEIYVVGTDVNIQVSPGAQTNLLGTPTLTFTYTPVPEPTTYAIFGFALLPLLAFRRKQTAI